MSSSQYERELKSYLEHKGWIVFRSAGSHGVDIIAISTKFEVYLIEVKSFQPPSYRVTKSPDDKEQWTEMCELQNKLCDEGVGPPALDLCIKDWRRPIFHVLYGLRMKGRGGGWKFALPSELHKPFHWLDASNDFDLSRLAGW